ncbi:MAG: amidohydrolase [Caldilinea sp.]|nr:amidohydrolase [Caldilineaceae bacterium]MCB9120253.1 amidohydrolase [Caldilineaceae bacterium]MCB9124085.1 amidohydrolase [Caldilineaceae bacterium]MCW5840705.1 amidohydrolase [Caldilinea sp.]HRW47391.1 amidohydrolase [Caldilinea sp.]
MQQIDSFKRAADALQPKLVAWRRDFHMHPELGFEEVRTAGIVADHLRGLGLEVSTGVGKTGVVAMVEPDAVAENAPTVMLRFDMDALPILEANDVPYRSTVDGVMHACGHDGHTAVGMGVAQVLTGIRNDLPGRVKLVFQPAEEGLGGAQAMIADGALEGPKPAAAFGLHLWSRMPLDQIVVQEGPLMAGADKIHLVVHGVGGHGAMPHETVDAVVVASEIVLAWQTIVSRTVSPTEPAVVTVGSFHAGSAANVIAGRAELSGSIRSFSIETRDLLVRRLREIAEGICAAHNARCEFTFTAGVLPTINSAAGAALMRDVAASLVGAEQVGTMTPAMVGEDMSEFLMRAPGCYVLVGANDPDGPLNSPHHSPTFDFDERMLSTGVALLAATAVEYLQREATAQ